MIRCRRSTNAGCFHPGNVSIFCDISTVHIVSMARTLVDNDCDIIIIIIIIISAVRSVLISVFR